MANKTIPTIQTNEENVGIGSTNPGAKLDVVGNINIDGLSFHRIANDSAITAPSDHGLVAYYGFDEGSSLLISDKTGRNNTSALGLTYTTTAIRGTALDGFGGNNNYVIVPDSADFDFGTGDFAVSLWCRPNSSFTNSSNTLIEIGLYTAGILIRPHSNTLQIYAQGSFVTGPAIVWAANVWYHIVVTRVSSVLNVYSNGTRIASVANTSNIQVASAGYIGRSAHTVGQFFYGIIDEVKIYKGKGLDYGEVRGQYLSRGDSMLVAPVFSTTNGRIGIGTTNPIASLEVDNSLTNIPILSLGGGEAGNNVSDLYVLNSYNNNTGVGYAAKVIGVNISGSLTDQNVPVQRTTWGGVTSATAIALGTDGPRASFQDNAFQIWTTNDASAGTLLTQKFSLTSAGDVGIGTVAPSQKLDVNGAIIAGINNSYGAYTRTPGGVLKPWFATSSANTFFYNTNVSGSIFWQNAADTATLMILTEQARLGINTNAPSGRLHVLDTVLYPPSLTWNAPAATIIRSENGQIAFGSDDTTPYGIWQQVRTSSSTARPLLLNPLGGNVGIGLRNPLSLLGVGAAGSTTAANGLTFGGDAQANLYRIGEDQIKTDGSLNVAGLIYNGNSAYYSSVSKSTSANWGQYSVILGNASYSAHLIHVSVNGGNVVWAGTFLATSHLSYRPNETWGTVKLLECATYNCSNDDVTLLTLSDSSKSQFGVPALVLKTNGAVNGGYGTGYANSIVVTVNGPSPNGFALSSSSWTQPYTYLIATSANTKQIYTNESGNVGIGIVPETNQANYKFLQVNGTNSAVIETMVGGTRIGGFDSTASALYVGTIGSFPLIFRTAVDEKMRIAAGGNVGIGSTNPGAKLDVVGTARLSSNLLSHKVASYTTSYPGISSFGADATDNNITYYDTGKTVLNVYFRGVVWTGKHYIFTDYINNRAYFYDNNFNQITNAYGYYNVTLPLPSGYGSPHGAAWDGRYLWVVVYTGSATKIVGYDLDTNPATIIAESAAIGAIGATYDIEYADGHLYLVANGTLFIYKWNGSSIDAVSNYPGAAGAINAQALTYDGSYLWATQNGAPIYKIGLDGTPIATISSGFPPDTTGWAWNGSNIVSFDWDSRNIFIINTTRLRIDTQNLALMGGRVGIGITNPGATLLSVGGAGSALPASGITFGAEAACNIYRSSTNQIKTDGSFVVTNTLLVGGGENGVRILKNGSDSISSTLYLANAANTRAYNFQQNPAGTNLNLWTYNSSNVWQNSVTFNYNGSVGIGTTLPSGKLHVVSSVSNDTVIRADGTNGTLFSVVDDLSDSLMSVNNSAGLPVLEVFADDRVVMGQYGSGDLVVANNKVGIGTTNPVNKLSVIGGASIGSTSYNVAAPANGLIVQGNVGIGLTNPTQKLHVKSSVGQDGVMIDALQYSEVAYKINGSAIKAYAALSSIAGGYVVGSSANAFIIRNDSDIFMTADAGVTSNITIKNGGNVGVGLTNPTSRLHVVEPTQTGMKLQFGTASASSIMNAGQVNNHIALFAPYNSNPASVSNNGAKWGIIMHGSLDNINANIAGKAAALYAVSEEDSVGGLGYNRKVGLAIHTSAFDASNTERVRINNVGNVGIGTTTPSYRLDITGGDINFASNSILRFGTVSVLNLSSNANDIYANLRVIRNSSATLADGMYIGYDGVGTTAAHLRFYANGTNERMRIQANDGFVGIGTATAVGRLDVYDDTNAGHVSFVRNLNSGSSAYTAIILRRNGGNNGLVMFTNSSARTTDGGASNSTIRTDNGKLLLGAHGTTYHALETDGNVGIGLTNPVAARLHIKGNGSNPVLRVESALLAGAAGGTAGKTFVGWMPIQTGALSPADTVYIPLYK